MLSPLEIKLIADEIRRDFEFDLELITRKVAEQLRNHDKNHLSQKAAYKEYGRAKVERWVENGQLKRFVKVNGKLDGYEYRIRDLEKLANKQQLLKLK